MHDTAFIYVLLPGDLDPEERHERYAVMLDAELQLAGVGHVSGSGSCFSLDDEDDDDAPDALFCGMDVDATDLDAARDLARASARPRLPGRYAHPISRRRSPDAG